ncbi:hypothetical protein KEM54_005064 [Ascosphaera aggregata]|nr:hypothetical protein KEM54_005064 [Ascosphaera aggregata]
MIKSKIYYLAYFAICLVVGFWVRGRQAYRAIIERILAILYHHHRTPELIQRDVKGLSQLPAHLSCVLKRKREASDDEVVDVLGDDVAELVAWSSCAGIPMLSIYERTGVLKPHIPKLHRMIVEKLAAYYGLLAQQPTIYLYAPHQPICSPELISPDLKTNHSSITVLLLSASDGRETLVDLTKTLAEMAQHGKISPHDISVKLVDAELCEIISPVPAVNNDGDGGDDMLVAAVGEHEGLIPTATQFVQQPVFDLAAHQQNPSAPFVKAEPDLLIVFGPYLKLDGYPPWAIRLTEMYCTGDKGDLITTGGGETVEYQKFLKGLWRYAKAEMRFGR